MNYLLFDLEKRRKVPVSNITINKSIPLNTSQNLNRRALIVKHYLNQKYAYSMREMQNNKVEPVVPQIVDEPKHVLLKEAFVPPKNEIKGNITLDINEDIKEKKVLKTESKPNSNTESESEKEEYECIQFKPMYDISIVDNHRGGWNYLIEYLCKSEFYNQKSKMVFFDMVESYFLWNKDYICHNKWCGIVHCTSKTPSYLNECNISFLFQNKNLFQSLKNCFLLITLSPNVRDYLDKELKKMNYKIRVVTLKHPVVSENIPLFSMDEYKKNSKKQLIQIGQQLRKISSIYRIKNKTHSKLWLTGNKDLNHSKSMLDRELSFYKMDNKRLNKVEMKYTKTFREYDNYLSKNIVFIDLFDAAANNSILECIIRNTPVIVNKIPGVVFYLGENYPLYFSNLQEVDEILKNEELILKAHEYLKNMDKTELTIEYFKNDLVTEISNTIDLQKSKKLNMSEKEEFRYICSKYMNSMKKVPLPDFDKNSMYESVLIEYRILPHLEFLIRNTILKLGEKWSHSVVCGNNNYEYMVQLCEKISPNINVIKTNYDNLFPSDYSRFLSSNEFWSLLNGEKILIYQEDSLIFKSDITIDEFMKWDYIGAPWTIYNNDNKAGVGNGGISLRSKSVMMKIMDTISIFDTKYNSSTTEYMNNTKSNVPPEDVYFSKNIEDLNIGSLADRKSAGRFSTESIYSKDCFAGHNFWLRDQNWRDRIHDLMSGLF